MSPGLRDAYTLCKCTHITYIFSTRPRLDIYVIWVHMHTHYAYSMYPYYIHTVSSLGLGLECGFGMQIASGETDIIIVHLGNKPQMKQDSLPKRHNEINHDKKNKKMAGILGSYV